MAEADTSFEEIKDHELVRDGLRESREFQKVLTVSSLPQFYVFQSLIERNKPCLHQNNTVHYNEVDIETRFLS
jgi:hypothetical protein